jgi:prephenate dehydrogenase
VTDAGRRVANVIGLGLVGGSIAIGLRSRGWRVCGEDANPATLERALEMRVIDAAGIEAGAAITFVAVPVLAVADQVKRALDETTGAVTDVGSVKAAICEACDDPRFVGGHPMAGSELDGLDGADGEMFNGAIWVLTRCRPCRAWSSCSRPRWWRWHRTVTTRSWPW